MGLGFLGKSTTASSGGGTNSQTANNKQAPRSDSSSGGASCSPAELERKKRAKMRECVSKAARK
jgi:hypothetical protein